MAFQVLLLTAGLLQLQLQAGYLAFCLFKAKLNQRLDGLLQFLVDLLGILRLTCELGGDAGTSKVYNAVNAGIDRLDL